jgi:two-component system OmpR family sensor kinase
VRARLVVALVLVSALGMAAGGAATFLIQRQRMLASVDASLLADIDAARLVVLGASNSTDPGNANGAVPEPFHTGADALQAVIGRVLPNRHQSSLGVLDGRARFVPGVPTDFRLQSVAGLVPRVVREVADGKTHLGTVPSSFGPVRYVATPVSVAGNPDRGIYVAAVDLDAQLGELSSTFATFWGVIAAAMILIGSSAWFIAGRLLNPIRTLRLAAARVTSTNRSERIPIVGHDDLSSLTRTVNLMLDRLDRAMTDQRQLLDDVRHELYTPVTIVRGHLEILNAYDPAEVDATRTLAIEELDRVTELVVDVASLTRQGFAKASILAGHEWALADITDATAALDPARITQAWLQLVDNAAKYSPLGSRIELGSTGHPDDIELWVADQGYGIPPEAADRIFARFGRVDTGRGISGSGLGLPIVKAIAESQGGSVGFVSAPGATRFSIVLPYHRETPAPEAVP